jgi:hypothetical protein
VDSDAELIARVSSAKDFFGRVCNDTLDDWSLAKDFGEFLVRILPDPEVMGHAILVRAHRHLGNRELALAELDQCRVRTSNRKPEPWEMEMLVPLLTEEQRLLSSRTS